MQKTAKKIKEKEMGNKKATGANVKRQRPFAGEEMLNHMGVSWFVSYAYYVYVVHSHRSWAKVSLLKRLYRFEKTVPHHLYWLDKIDSMDDKKLATNGIRLKPATVKVMAKKILKKLWKMECD